MTSLRLLSGGAAQGLVNQLQERFAQRSGCQVQGTFGAVGLMRDQLLAGAPCDLLILTQALMEQLAASGQVDGATLTPLGVVRTGVAVPAGAPMPAVDSAQALQAALLAAEGIYFPDPQKATAGIHFMKVLQALGVDTAQAQRLHTFPNGATAMAALAAAGNPRLIGCTQVTEILYTPGVQLAGLLPPQFELATVYTAGVCRGSALAAQARDFIALLASAEAAPLRSAGGFSD